MSLFGNYDSWKATPPPDDREEWRPIGCVYCIGDEDRHDDPCSEDCERIAVHLARQRRLATMRLSLASCHLLAARYRDEGDRPGASERLDGTLARATDLETEIEDLQGLMGGVR